MFYCQTNKSAANAPACLLAQFVTLSHKHTHTHKSGWFVSVIRIEPLLKRRSSRRVTAVSTLPVTVASELEIRRKAFTHIWGVYNTRSFSRQMFVSDVVDEFFGSHTATRASVCRAIASAIVARASLFFLPQHVGFEVCRVELSGKGGAVSSSRRIVIEEFLLYS